MGPMSRSETREYVRHRLRIAAGTDTDLFSDRALREIYRRTRGVPRPVNLLCDRSLLAGYALSSHRLGADVVGRAARELLGAYRRHRPRRFVLRRGFAAIVFAAMLAVLGWQWVEHTEFSIDLAPAVGAAAPHLLEIQEEPG